MQGKCQKSNFSDLFQLGMLTNVVIVYYLVGAVGVVSQEYGFSN